MADLRAADFYYGAILSTLLNRGICPALIEGGSDRQIYSFTTNQTDFTLFAKYRSTPIDTKKEDYQSWQFALTANEQSEIRKYLQDDKEFVLCLLCGNEALQKSEYALLNRQEVETLLAEGKTSFSISRKKGEKNHRISLGDGRENALQITPKKFW